jgi:tRNA threonylcarbamoyladenosine biosynthesis protein TsaE
MKTVLVHTLEDWEVLARELIAPPAKAGLPLVITLSGDLGVGKTTFVQTLARILGVSEVVTSPTFTIMKQYDLPEGGQLSKLVHIDAYRIDDPAEMVPLRGSEIFTDAASVICIEWPERIAAVIPFVTYAITIDLDIATGERTVTINHE